MNRRRIAPVAIAAVVVGIVVASFVLWPRGGTAVTEDEAVDAFRSSEQGADARGEPTALPTPGVYSFAATGQEDIKLGPLPSETRPYPTSIPVTVNTTTPICFQVRVDLLAEHHEQTTYCRTDTGGMRVAAHTKNQMVGPITASATMTCREDELFAVTPTAADPPASPGTTLAADGALDCSLSLSGGPMAITAQLTGTATTRTATFAVDGTNHDAIVVDIRYTVAGDLTGSWDEELWVATDDGTPLRIDRQLSLNGLATFTERSTLELSSRTPSK